MNIAAMAEQYKKPSKADAQNMVKALYESATNDADRAKLAQLYKFYVPTATKKPKTVFDWVALAMGKKDVREYLNYVYVTESHITATDGHRMHRVPNNTALSVGFYNKGGDLVHGEDFAKFPDVARIIPSVMDRAIVYTQDGIELQVGEIQGTVTYILPNGAHVNKKYYDDVVAYGNVTFYLSDSPNDSVLVKRGEHTAVVMPMRA